MSAVAKALELIKDEEIEYVDVRFTDPKGKLQHVTLVAELADEDFFEEGFRFDGCIDIFDAGPTMTAEIDGLKAVRDSRVSEVDVGPCEAGIEVLACHGAGEGFCASRGRAELRGERLRIGLELAQALQVQTGDRVRHVEF